MTEEEKAKKYAISRTYPFMININFVLCEVERAFLAGLKASKDMNVPIKWHKVADGDLPKEQKEYWCKVFFYESEETFNAFLWFDLKTKSFKFLEEIKEDIESTFNVKAWCEIPEYIEE